MTTPEQRAKTIAEQEWRRFYPGMEPDGAHEVIVAALAHYGMLGQQVTPETRPRLDADRLLDQGLENLSALVAQLLHEHTLHGHLLSRLDEALAEVRERADSAAEEHHASGRSALAQRGPVITTTGLPTDPGGEPA